MSSSIITARARPPAPRPATWKPRLVVACGQMEVTPDIAANRAVILRQMREAKRDHGAGLIVFPETSLSGYAPVHHLPPPEGAASIDFPALTRALADVRSAARALRIAVVVGTTTRSAGRLFNSAVAVDARGRATARYDKQHLMPMDRTCFTPGAARLRPARLAGTRAGLQICFDMRFPEPWRILALAGARLFLHPTYCVGRDQLWKRAAVEANLSSRASENSCWLASANAAGPCQFVSSRIIDPDGLVIARAQDDAEQVISAAIDPAWMGRSGGFLAVRRRDLE
ncbi:MAG: carbon-nitrogen hydrolase family protein [Planctomycetes bacterium]|nr:carbon-nitrogen hydrolase family protein [Planctomycetota bacterium]